MTIENEAELSRLCVHSITTKPWTLNQSVDKYQQAGIGGISIWQDAAGDIGITQTRDLLDGSDLDVVSYVRGGFFAWQSLNEREKVIDHNKRLIDDAAIIGAPLLVLVCGADPNQALHTSVQHIQAGIEAIIPHAEQSGVKLGIEPLHPMYADTRSAIVHLGQANDVAEKINHDFVGIVIDVYHLWWDDRLEQEIKRCGELQNIFGFHTCDWKNPTLNMLTDRGLMGEGCIPTREIRQWVDDTGYDGYIEVEIFSDKYWASDQDEFLAKIIQAYKHYA